MAWLGGVLLVGGGLWWALLRCGEKRRRLRLGRELCRQLPTLERGVLVQRRPLWELAEELSRSGGETAFFWAMLGRRLMGEESCACCWRSATGVLPAPYDDLLGPLGEALAGGGRDAEALLIQTRRELTLWLEEAKGKMADEERLMVVLGVSVTAMLALVLI